mgnify:CR=1 FL=1
MKQAYESIPESIGNMVSEAVFTRRIKCGKDFFILLPENAYVVNMHTQ